MATIKTFSISVEVPMRVWVGLNVDAENEEQARAQALAALQKMQAEGGHHLGIQGALEVDFGEEYGVMRSFVPIGDLGDDLARSFELEVVDEYEVEDEA
jgi:hypothetical protein